MEDEEAAGRSRSEAFDAPVGVCVQGDIDTDTPAAVREALQSAEDARQTVFVVKLNSGGGCCYSALACIDALEGWRAREAGRRIVCVAEGMCFSAALPVFCMGDDRCALPLTSFLSHDLSSVNTGSLQQLKQNTTEAERVNDLLDGFVKARINDEAEHEALFGKGDVYFDARRAASLGVATCVGHPKIRVDLHVDLPQPQQKPPSAAPAAAPPAAPAAPPPALLLFLPGKSCTCDTWPWRGTPL